MILKAMFWQLMDRDNRIRIPHPLQSAINYAIMKKTVTKSIFFRDDK